MQKFAATVALFLCSTIAFAELNTVVEHQTYEISGDTAKELKQEMRQKGPRGYFAYTSWDIRFHYKYQRQNSYCALSKIRVDLKIVYTLPEFDDYDDADNELKQNWANYMSNLQIHEDGHAQNGLGAAREIDAMLSHLPAMNNCEELNQAANQKANEIIRKYNILDTQYDAETKHGLKQGAVL